MVAAVTLQRKGHRRALDMALSPACPPPVWENSQGSRTASVWSFSDFLALKPLVHDAWEMGHTPVAGRTDTRVALTSIQYRSALASLHTVRTQDAVAHAARAH